MMDAHELAWQKLRQADLVLVGASNGLSITEGIHIFGRDADFRARFGDFSARYGFESIIQGCFHPFADARAYWAFFARLFVYMNDEKPAGKVMQNLLATLRGKDHFVLTSNFDNHFRQAGLDESRLFEVEGVGKDFQCARQCTDAVWDGSAALRAMAQAEEGGLVPPAMVPVCPCCGGAVKIHVQLDGDFQHDAHWHARRSAWQHALAQGRRGNTVLLELGVGAANRLIKLPFMQYVHANENAFYISVNKGDLWIPDEIAARSLGLNADLAQVLQGWAQRAL